MTFTLYQYYPVPNFNQTWITSILFDTHFIGPVVSKHGNLGPVVRACGAGSPTDR